MKNGYYEGICYYLDTHTYYYCSWNILLINNNKKNSRKEQELCLTWLCGFVPRCVGIAPRMDIKSCRIAERNVLRDVHVKYYYVCM